MSVFNKQGTEFKHLVKIAPAPGQPTTYTHSFPVLGKGGKVEERWSTKVRPIKDLTHILQGCQLRRNKDYMIDFNGTDYEYWFLDSRHALLFQLAASNIQQTTSQPGYKFDIECPHCQGTFKTEQIVWK